MLVTCCKSGFDKARKTRETQPTMMLTIDTTQPLSFTDYQLLAALLTLSGGGPAPQAVPAEAETGATVSNEAEEGATRKAQGETLTDKPKRTRRTKAQIAADEAKALADEPSDNGTADDGVVGSGDEPTTHSEDAESDAAADTGATLAQLTEAASKLVTTDRDALKSILAKHELTRVSNTPAELYAVVLADIEAALA